MLSQDTNIRFYSHPKMCQLPIGTQSEVMSIFEDILNDVKEENSNATVSELLLSDTVSTELSESITESDSESVYDKQYPYASSE